MSALPAVDRCRLPGRRISQTLAFQHRGTEYCATLGYYWFHVEVPEQALRLGNLGEVFLNSGKIGSDIDVHMRDAAIACSLALQYGCPPEVLRGAFLRDAEGRAEGPLAALFDLLAARPAGAPPANPEA